MDLILPNLCRLSIVGVCGDDQQELQKARENFFILKIKERLAYAVEARRTKIVLILVEDIRNMMNVGNELQLYDTNPFEFKIYAMLKMCVFTHVFLMDPGFTLHTGKSPNSREATKDQLETIQRFVAAFVPWGIKDIASKDTWTDYEAQRPPTGIQHNSFCNFFLSDKPELNGHFFRCAALLHIAYETEIDRFERLTKARTTSIRFKAGNDNSTDLTLNSFDQTVEQVFDSNKALLEDAKKNLCGNQPDSFTMYGALSTARGVELERREIELEARKARAIQLVKRRLKRQGGSEEAKRSRTDTAAQPDQ